MGRLAGIELPLMPVEHHYLVTETVPEIQAMDRELPTFSDSDSGCYLRQEGKGMLVGAYERTCVHWAEDGTPADFDHELLPDPRGAHGGQLRPGHRRVSGARAHRHQAGGQTGP